MRSVTFKSIYEGVVRRLGLDPIGDAIDHDTARMIADHTTERMINAWKFWDFPQQTRTEERSYRQVWMPTVQYLRSNSDGLPDEVYYNVDGNYYQVDVTLSADPPVGTLPTDAIGFIPLNPVTQYIERDQPFATPYDMVLEVYSQDPSTVAACNISTIAVDFIPSEKGVTIINGPPQTVFVQFQTIAPTFTMIPFILGKAYVPGDNVFNTSDGNCYVCIGQTTTHYPNESQFWSPFLIPDFFSSYLKFGVVADCLRENNSGDEQARAIRAQAIADADGQAQAALEREVDELLQQGQKHHWMQPRERQVTWKMLDGGVIVPVIPP